MSRHLAWGFLAVVMLAVNVPLHAKTYEVGGCKTGASYVNFTTISAAVVGVPAGSKIEICPGVYPEQVTITQPLALEGITFGNASRAAITANPNGSFAPNVSGLFGDFYAQVLVQNVNPPGPVNITGITVDGAGITIACSGEGEFLAGIFYASGTSGTVNEVTGRNNQNNGCGFSIWVENGAATNQSITVENNSIHQGGIIAMTSQNPPSLTATIKGNFVASTSQTNNFNDFQGVAVVGANGSVTGNVITGGDRGIVFGNDNYFNGGSGTVNVSQNTVADIFSGIEFYGANGVISSNKLSQANLAFSFVDPGDPVTLEGNTTMNSSQAVSFIACASESTITKNVFNDSQVAFRGIPSPIAGNSLYNIDTVVTGSCWSM